MSHEKSGCVKETRIEPMDDTVAVKDIDGLLNFFAGLSNQPVVQFTESGFVPLNDAARKILE
ncbi:MAG: hypothetical protein CEO19_360 [Parcubacteria group bacterium Gr01-1014_73]|nr:MAG: hypothetical protein CEO19_360 [Parcubacteria group bacterium Gr01-1014_73]